MSRVVVDKSDLGLRTVCDMCLRYVKVAVHTKGRISFYACRECLTSCLSDLDDATRGNKPEPGKVKVRIPVLVADSGDWSSSAWSLLSEGVEVTDKDKTDACWDAGISGDVYVIHWLEAGLDIPSAPKGQTVMAHVVPQDVTDGGKEN